MVVVRTDNAPKFSVDESGKRMVAENSPAGANVVGGDTEDMDGDPVRATDADDTAASTGGQLLTYSLSGADAGSFSIISDTITSAALFEVVRLRRKPSLTTRPSRPTW